MDKKFCNKCKKTKELTEFYKRGKYYCSQCKDCMKENNRNWHKNNLERVKERRKKFKENNPNYNIDYMKKWRKDNKEHIKEYKRQEYYKNKGNYMYKLKIQTKHLITKAFKRKKYKKNSKTQKILGCDYDFFIKYLLNTYKRNYNTEWDEKEKIHIDHIIPISTAKNYDDVVRLNHYTNLQLLKEKDNLNKSNKLNWKLGGIKC